MHLKTSGKVTIGYFATHLEQLNSYLGCLPGLVGSPKANKMTEQIKPIDEAKLAQTSFEDMPNKVTGSIQPDPREHPTS